MNLNHRDSFSLSRWTNAVFLLVLSLTSSASAQSPKGERYLIIHSDDAGMSHSVNQATFEALEKGIVTSASIMVPCPWFKEFAQYAKEHPKYDYGIHLTLNSEWDVYRWGPVAPRDQVASLLDAEGYLCKGTEQVAMQAKAEEVRRELKAQIDKAIAFGVPLSHLDTHMGSVMTRPDLVEVYVDLALEYHLPVLFFKEMSPEAKKEYPALADRFPTCFIKLTDKKLPLLDNLLQFYGGDNPRLRKDTYLDAIKSLPVGVTQLIIHCGIDNDELRGITSSSARRDQDYRLFISPEIQDLLKAEGVRTITWREFHDMSR